MRPEAHPDWIRPDWPAPPTVQAVFTTRAGGVSARPYDGLNLGDHVGDDRAHVRENRALLQSHMAAKPVYLQQVHGTQVLVLAPDSAHDQSADASVTHCVGLACTVLVADCLPVLLATRDGCCVAAAHAGWRGLAGGVLAQTVSKLRQIHRQYSPADAAQDETVMAWLGPCIGPQAFEVGPEVRQAFEAIDGCSATAFQPHAVGKWLADLPALARRQLAKCGVKAVYGNDGGADWCTVKQASRFFSYRRDGVSGRMAASIWRC
jgi:polyphenol oxidase